MTQEEILEEIVDFHDRNGLDGMQNLIDSGETELGKWDVAWTHGISMRYLFAMIETLQGKVRNLEEKQQLLIMGKDNDKATL